MQSTPFFSSNYRIGRVIGLGAFSEVRFAIQISTNRPVAIKIIDTTRLNSDSLFRMRREISILSTLSKHSNVISLIEVIENIPYRGTWCTVCTCSSFGPSDHPSSCSACFHSENLHSRDSFSIRSCCFIVTELGAGGELFGILQDGPFDEKIARYYFNQLLNGLSYCHEGKVIHRDVKSENIVFDFNFDLKIIDFGLATYDMNEIAPASNNTHDLYTAPEVFSKRKFNGECADVWSCGVILFIMLTGRPPFRRPLLKNLSPVAKLLLALRKCKFFISIMNGDYPDSLSPSAIELFKRIFTVDPSERITVSEIRKSSFLSGELPSYNDLHRIMFHRSSSYHKSHGNIELLNLLSDYVDKDISIMDIERDRRVSETENCEKNDGEN